jgi:hypothetical protein
VVLVEVCGSEVVGSLVVVGDCSALVVAGVVAGVVCGGFAVPPPSPPIWLKA